MHVVHLYDGHEKVYGGRGSVPGVVWNIARETVRAGHEVTVVERQWDGLPPTAEHEGVEFVRLDLRTGADEPWTRVPYEVATDPIQFTQLVGDRVNFARRALGLLEQMDVDVLHVHLPFAANVVVSIAPAFRDRMVFTAHLGELRLDILEGDQRGDTEDGPDVPAIVKAFSPDVYLAKRASRTTVLNSSIADVLVDRGVPAESVETVPNGVDTERFGDVDPAALERVRSTYGIGERPTLLFVGTLMPRKGVTEFVRALDTVVNDYGREVDVILAGEPELDTGYVDEVQSLVEAASLGSAVSMPGFVPATDLPALYHAADLFVVPSLEEGFGMTAIEAMAAGTPVVGTRVGALPDIIDPGRTGTLADPGDVAGLADAIDNALAGIDATDSAVRTRANDYSWPSVAEEFTSIYDEVSS